MEIVNPEKNNEINSISYNDILSVTSDLQDKSGPEAKVIYIATLPVRSLGLGSHCELVVQSMPLHWVRALCFHDTLPPLG